MMPLPASPSRFHSAAKPRALRGPVRAGAAHVGKGGCRGRRRTRPVHRRLKRQRAMPSSRRRPATFKLMRRRRGRIGGKEGCGDAVVEVGEKNRVPTPQRNQVRFRPAEEALAAVAGGKTPIAPMAPQGWSQAKRGPLAGLGLGLTGQRHWTAPRNRRAPRRGERA